MGGTKTKTEQVQTQNQNQNSNTTNTYGYVPGPTSTDIDAMRDFEFTGDPRLPYTFARARKGVEGVYNNPMGKYTNQALRDAQLANSYEDLGVDEAQAQREENYGLQGLRYGQTADVAAMTQPRFVQTGGSSSSSGTSTGTGNSTQTQTQSPLNSIISGGSGIASALIM